MEPQLRIASINILTVVDTEYVKSVCPAASRNPRKPTPIEPVGLYTLCTGASEIVSEPGASDLSLVACCQDTIAFRGVSIYDNSVDAVIVYHVKPGTIPGRRFFPVLTRRDGAVQPDPASENGGIPALHTGMNFASLNSIVEASSEDAFDVRFALYTLDVDGQTQRLFGYYCYVWNLSVAVAEHIG